MKKVITNKCYSIEITPNYCYLFFGKELVAKKKLNQNEIEVETAEKLISKYIKVGGYKHWLKIMGICGVKCDRNDESVYLDYLSSKYVSLLRGLKNKLSEVVLNEQNI